MNDEKVGCQDKKMRGNSTLFLHSQGVPFVQHFHFLPVLFARTRQFVFFHVGTLPAKI